VLTWDSLPHEAPSRRDWSGLDRYLRRVYEQTSFVHHLGRLLSGKRLLVYEPRGYSDRAGVMALRDLKMRFIAAVLEYEDINGNGVSASKVRCAHHATPHATPCAMRPTPHPSSS
jgi:predicted nucleic acid-binding protein